VEELPVAPGFLKGGTAEFFEFLIRETGPAGSQGFRSFESSKLWQSIKDLNGDRFCQHIAKDGEVNIDRARGEPLDQAGIAIAGKAGFTDTPMVRALGEEFIRTKVLPQTQLKRLIRPEEIADAICFMIANAAVSGELWADAGWRPSA